MLIIEQKHKRMGQTNDHQMRIWHFVHTFLKQKNVLLQFSVQQKNSNDDELFEKNI